MLQCYIADYIVLCACGTGLGKFIWTFSEEGTREQDFHATQKAKEEVDESLPPLAKQIWQLIAIMCLFVVPFSNAASAANMRR